jgi:tRNA threonylcarbamoyladenosine biosynthesis protein TsaE
MATCISASPEETEKLGWALGRAAMPGWVIGLTGDVGAGKTRLARGIARGLGVPGRVASPTFALVLEHGGGRWPLYHLDLYRLDTLEQILGAGLEPYFCEPPGVVVVEWYDRWTGPPPRGLHRLHLAVLSERERRIDHEPPGA